MYQTFSYNAPDYNKLIKSESDFILSLQLPNGAIVMNREPGMKIGVYNPYFACYAMLGLLESNLYFDVVKKYMDYHISHLNESDVFGVSGTIYDYTIHLDTYEETASCNYDSSDSYAALMLQLMKRYAEVSGDTDYFIDKKENVELITAAMLSTMDHGLTWAKPAYKVKYLMDNCEVHQGLKDAAWLFSNVFHDPALSLKYSAAAEQIKGKINEAFYDRERGLYTAFLTETGAGGINMGEFYPDAICQLFPILCDVLPAGSKEANRLYDTFNSQYGGWTKMDCSEHSFSVILWAALKMKDVRRCNDFLDRVTQKLEAEGHRYPWYCSESGFVFSAACKLAANS